MIFLVFFEIDLNQYVLEFFLVSDFYNPLESIAIYLYNEIYIFGRQL